MDEGLIIPSYMSMGGRGHMVDMGNQSDTSLRFGEVKAIVFPDDEKSVSRQYIEYTVNVHHKDSTGPGSTQTYGGCVVSNTFGLGGDLLRFTLRPDSAKTNQKNAQVGIGAKVLLLCINGDRPRAVIIGGLRDPLTQADDDEKDKRDDGHNLRFQFNGLSAVINKDGELLVEFKGATDASNKLLDGVQASDSGTQFQLLKNGNFNVTHDSQILTLDHRNKGWKMESTNFITHTTDGDWSAVAQKTSTLTGKSSVDINTDNTATVTAANIKLGSSGAGEHLVLGDTYRQGESMMMKSLMSSLTSLGTSLTTLNLSVTTAGTALKVPITGGVLASPAFVAMTVQIAAMSATISKMMGDLQTFEASATTYLSGSHTTE